jgi:hypothetical protein
VIRRVLAEAPEGLAAVGLQGSDGVCGLLTDG